MKGKHLGHVLLPLAICSACGGPNDDEAHELEAFLSGAGDTEQVDLDRLNVTFARQAVRSAGYARAGIAAPTDEAWMPIVELGDGDPRAIDVTPWSATGDLTPGGAFDPRARDSATFRPTGEERELLERWSGASCLEDRANRVAGAAGSLVRGPRAVVFTPPRSYAIADRPVGQRLELNSRLLALVRCAPAEAPAGDTLVQDKAPSHQIPSSGASPPLAPQRASEPLKNHEPPPETQQEGDSSDCDCDDLWGCTNSKSTGGSSTSRSTAGSGLLLAAFAFRRRSRRVDRTRRSPRAPSFLLLGALLFSVTKPAHAQEANAASPGKLVVQAFAPDAAVAVDGVVVGTGSWSGDVAPGRHLVQVYRPNGPRYDFQVDVAAGATQNVPGPGAQATYPPSQYPAGYAPAPYGPAPAPNVAEPPPPKPKTNYLRVGPYAVAQIALVFPTTKPDGFRYELTRDSDTGEPRERSGVGYMTGASLGYRLSRAIGFGGLVLYARAGGAGTVEQIEVNPSGGTLSHTGPADFTIQSLRLGPQLRLMAGANRGRFLSTLSFGVQQTWVDLDHVDVGVAGGALIERGTFHHDYSGLGQFFGFDLGGEFNVADQLLMGFAFDGYVDGTSRISGDPFGATLMGYFGFSARLGWHNWTTDE